MNFTLTLPNPHSFARIAVLALIATGFAFAAPEAQAASADKAAQARAAADVKQLVLRARKPAPRTRAAVPKKLRPALSKAAKLAAALATKSLARKFKPNRRLGKRARSAGAPLAMTVAGPSARSGGVEISTSATVRKDGAGAIELELAIKLQKDKQKASLTSTVSDAGGDFGLVPCPTADGKIELRSTRHNSMTVAVTYGGAKASATDKLTSAIVAEGTVGRDARFSGLTAELTTKVEHFERGLQISSTLRRGASIARAGEATLERPNAETTVKAASASPRQERAAANEVARDLERDQGFADAAKSLVRRARFQMLEAEPKWYDLPGSCAKIELTPASGAELTSGEAIALSGVLRAADGAQAVADFEATAIGRGEFTALLPIATPGAPATFNVKAATPDDNRISAQAELLATSPAGRAKLPWIAKAPVKRYVVSYSGTMDYARNEGDSTTSSQHLVKADFSWTVVWRGVDPRDPTVAMPSYSSFDGDWSDTGRHGATGPGDFLCGGPLESYSSDMAMLTTTETATGFKVEAMPFLTIGPNIDQVSCSGLPGPPFANYYVTGNDPTVVGKTSVTWGDVESSSVTRTLTPDLAPLSCEALTVYQTPCMQSALRDAKLTIYPEGWLPD